MSDLFGPEEALAPEPVSRWTFATLGGLAVVVAVTLVLRAGSDSHPASGQRAGPVDPVVGSSLPMAPLRYPTCPVRACEIVSTPVAAVRRAVEAAYGSARYVLVATARVPGTHQVFARTIDALVGPTSVSITIRLAQPGDPDGTDTVVTGDRPSVATVSQLTGTLPIAAGVTSSGMSGPSGPRSGGSAAGSRVELVRYLVSCVVVGSAKDAPDDRTVLALAADERLLRP